MMPMTICTVWATTLAVTVVGTWGQWVLGALS